ncbi:ASCH domain-containing protein [Virgibacillus halodenitrificans]|uniref:ASCH domain-containing protein n=1 Tax=Virgibacillus halodenitrificans TaxID=1482 RepID=UPI001FB46715|nr:ASCH domain-containing protein [Virgibacillus halodenitrificans]MCJ0932419.1 ASCH domain-containing protein [Virgibacillus halodenitrificans]
MLHKMKLNEGPFTAMESGKKTIEVRLNDPKRQGLSVGDRIEFRKLPELKEKLEVHVISLETFNTFEAMYLAIPTQHFGDEGGSLSEMVEATYEIYSPSQEEKWGTLAIGVKLIKER